MWFIHEIVKDIMVEPKFFGPSFFSTIFSKVIDDLEGKLLGEFEIHLINIQPVFMTIGELGYVVSIININKDTIEYKPLNRINGIVNVRVEVSALMYRIFTREVIDCIVKSTSESGLILSETYNHRFFLQDSSVHVVPLPYLLLKMFVQLLTAIFEFFLSFPITSNFIL